MNEHNEVANIVADAMEVFIKNNFNKPMTNYERIKSMSVEEMAEFIEKMTEHLEICTRCPAYKMCDTHIKCGENIKQWLLQEVSEDE